MNRIPTKALVATSFALILAIALFACGCTQQAGEQPSIAPPGGQARETITLSGSTTVLPIAQAAADAYMDIHENVEIQVTGGGSSIGVQAAGEGTADIGMSSRDIKAEEKARYSDLVATVIGNDGIAVIVHPENTVGPLGLDEIKGIYQGRYTNWKDLGGPDLAIVVVGRTSASGTAEFFHERVS